jgi:hypothetical protein
LLLDFEEKLLSLPSNRLSTETRVASEPHHVIAIFLASHDYLD